MILSTVRLLSGTLVVIGRLVDSWTLSFLGGLGEGLEFLRQPPSQPLHTCVCVCVCVYKHAHDFDE